MKIWAIAGAALFLFGCGTDAYNQPNSCLWRNLPSAIASDRPIYQVDTKNGEFKRDRRAERIRDLGAQDGSTDQGGTFGW